MDKNRQRNTSNSFVMPAVGDNFYMPSMLYLSHGVDDFHGGKCTISKVIPGESPRDTYIEVAERPGVQCRYLPLLADQEELKAEYGDARGHMSHDYRPEFNDDPY